MESFRSFLHVLLLFVEVFFVFISTLFLVGAVMSTAWAWFGVILSIGGFIYALWNRQEDIIDRYFYFILGLMFTFILAFIDLRM